LLLDEYGDDDLLLHTGIFRGLYHLLQSKREDIYRKMGEYCREMEMIGTETLQISEGSLRSKRSTLLSRSISGFVFVISDEDPYLDDGEIYAQQCC
jgi:hypothetical protein